jgi:hypothetical protein
MDGFPLLWRTLCQATHLRQGKAAGPSTAVLIACQSPPCKRLKSNATGLIFCSKLELYVPLILLKLQLDGWFPLAMVDAVPRHPFDQGKAAGLSTAV